MYAHVNLCHLEMHSWHKKKLHTPNNCIPPSRHQFKCAAASPNISTVGIWMWREGGYASAQLCTCSLPAEIKNNRTMDSIFEYVCNSIWVLKIFCQQRWPYSLSSYLHSRVILNGPFWVGRRRGTGRGGRGGGAEDTRDTSA